MFRIALGRLLTGEVKRLKAGPAGVEVEYWERAIAEAREELNLERTLPPNGAATADETPQTFRNEMVELAAVSPRSAVMESFRRVELQLRSMLESSGAEQVRPVGARTMAEMALQRELITGATLDAIRGMSTLRNLAAHDRDDSEIDERRALEFVDLTEAILFALERESPS